MKIEDNRAARLLAGSFTIFLLYRLWSAGWFDLLFAEETEGFSDPALTTMLISCVVSAVELVGLLAIGLVTNILTPLVDPVMDWMGGLVGTVKGKISLPAPSSRPSNEIDASKLAAALDAITKRLDALDGGNSDG